MVIKKTPIVITDKYHLITDAPSIALLDAYPMLPLGQHNSISSPLIKSYMKYDSTVTGLDAVIDA